MQGVASVQTPPESSDHALSIGMKETTRDTRLIGGNTAAPPWRRRSWALLLVSLVIVAGLIAKDLSRGEFHYYGDEAQHAVTGLYFADFFRDLPLKEPADYTYRYYAQYPALGVVHWPPLFHVVEGLFFLLLGPTVGAARLTVLLFTLVGLVYWFRFVRELHGDWAGFAATLGLWLLPSLLYLEKAVLLEAPSLAVCIVASFYWVRYLKTGATRSLFLFAFVAALALLTKQHAVYMATFCGLTILLRRDWHLIFNRRMVAAFLLVVVVAGPFYAVMLSVHGQTIQGHTVSTIEQMGRIGPYTYYWIVLVQQLGVPLLILSAAGILTSRLWDQRENTVIMLAWIVAFYVTLTPLPARDERYAVYWLPPFLYFAFTPLIALTRQPKFRRVATATVCAILLVHLAIAAAHRRPYIEGYSQAAQRVIQEQGRGLILFDGPVPGNFIFFMRAHDPNRRFVVMRKALYATRITRGFGAEQLVHSKVELSQLIDYYGIHCVIVSRNTSSDFEIQKELREFLSTPQFRLMDTIPIRSNTIRWQGAELLVYENLKAPELKATTMRIRMLTLDRDIIVNLGSIPIR